MEGIRGHRQRQRGLLDSLMMPKRAQILTSKCLPLAALVLAVAVAGCGSENARSAAGEDELPGDEVVVIDESSDASDDDSADDDSSDTAADEDSADDSGDTPADTDDDSAKSAADGGLLLPESSILGQLRSNLGVNICVTNSTSSGITVVPQQYDSARGQGLLAPGQEACVEGTSVWEDDVSLEVRIYNGRISWWPLIIGNNPWTGSPSAYVYNCTDDSGMDVGKSRYWDSGILAFDIKREADSGWKQFRINVTDSPNPLPLGETPPCRGPAPVYG